jgi:prophage tail gpP-like protein
VISHDVTAIVNGQQIDGWQSYNFESSLITPADTFVMRMPFNATAYRTLRRDSRITILVDGVTMLDGFIDRRVRHGRQGVLEINGRDRVGRLIDESAPAITYDGLTIEQAVKLLASPWFSTITLSDAKNRLLRRGKGRRVASGNEPVVTINVRVPRRGQVHPGESRWHLIHEIVSRAGLICYSSSDGKELIIGKPNQTQAPQYKFVYQFGNSDPGTVKDIMISEDDGDRYSLILCAGVGGQSTTNYGKNVIDNRGVVFDNPFNKLDGTGRDFIHPKRLFLPERAFDSYGDAQRVAKNEQARRDYKRHVASIEMDGFGQNLGGGALTLFAPDTVGHLIDAEAEIDDTYLLVSCSYSGAHDTGDVTNIHMVPTGTEIVL